MRRVLFSVLGVGLGHATRVHAILNELRGVKYKILASGEAYKYFRLKGFTPIKLGGIEFPEKEFAFDLFSTLLKNLDYPIKMTANYRKIVSVLEEFRPDVIFCDSEPSTFLVAEAKGYPLYSLTNLITLFDEAKRVSLTKEMERQLFVIKRLMEHVIRNSEKVFVPTFIKAKSYLRRITYVNPIVRKERGQVKERDFYLVMLGGSPFAYHVLGRIIELASSYEDRLFVISTNWLLRGISKRRNMVLYPFLPLSYMKHARAVITLGGYSTLSEAVSFKKPVLSVPIKGHVEQFLNAHMIERLGFGLMCRRVEKLEKYVEKFFEKEEEFRENLEKANVRGNGAEQIARSLQGL
ncbi:MAG: hypothetical protein J7L59_03090 [Nanoarchaeota archaeon]|nr:hypothetical protein [Nanoarchaeota archaeon]